MILKKLQMNYDLTKNENKLDSFKSLREIFAFLKNDRFKVFSAIIVVFISSGLNVYAPLQIGQIIDNYIVNREVDNLLNGVIVLLVIYASISLTSYLQIYIMGKVGQNVLFNVRSLIFQKLQSLPLAFFNLNRAGDLISRINNDTEKLNQAFSEVFLRFIGSIFIILGIGIYMLILNPKLGITALSISFILIILTRILTPIIQKQNKIGLIKFGDLSADVQQNLNNFRVIVAFNRRKYLRDDFEKVNNENYIASIKTSFYNALLSPIFDFGSNLALLISLGVGINMLLLGEITIGLLITFVAYISNFYQPLKILANLYGSIQSAIASWSRVSEILNLESNLKIKVNDFKNSKANDNVITFSNVSFSYDESKKVINNVSFSLKRGKTYAFVGPTGGGKSTTASLIARLYDPTDGSVLLDNIDLKSYSFDELSRKIGFILQEPIIFTDSILNNIKYGNEEFKNLSSFDFKQLLIKEGLNEILERFDGDLDKEISQSGNNISLGQKQLIAFLRIYLRKPTILILDEATANIDTVTESILQKIILKLSDKCTKIIIAHRLNTIKNADEIFFIADGEVTSKLSFKDAIDLINQSKIKS